MKPYEILAALPAWSSAPPAALLDSPAWAMPCRLGDDPCTLRLDAPLPADTLNIAVRIGDDSLVIGLADTPRHPELHALWSTRAEVPENVLLALAERECGPLFQLLENTFRRQLRVESLASDDAASAARPPLSAHLLTPEGEEILSFTLTRIPAVESAWGQLRFIQPTHPAVRDATLPAETEYATFTLPPADLATLAPGDALLLPELAPDAPSPTAPRLVIDRRFALSSSVEPWTDTDQLRVLADPDSTATVGSLLDAASAEEPPAPLPVPPEGAPLRLVRGTRTLVAGRLEHLGPTPAFLVETATPSAT